MNKRHLQAHPKHIDSLPAELLSQSTRKLSVVDRLNGERVSPRWNLVIWGHGWTEQRKLNNLIAFEGTNPEQRIRFSAEDLISLLQHVAGQQPNHLVELDLYSFAFLKPSAAQIAKIAKSLQHLEELEKLDIREFQLSDFVHFLPPNLRFLEASRGISVQTLETLAANSPNLEVVPFACVEGVTYQIVNEYLPKFPRQKTLALDHHCFFNQRGNLTAISGLQELDVLKFQDFGGCDQQTLESIAVGCTQLRKLGFFDIEKLTTEATLFPLAEMPNLSVLEICWDNSGAFTDSVLKKIARRGQLKSLRATFCENLTDDSIVFLVGRCQSLVSLNLSHCEKITDRSLEAVLAEVQRRHGSPPRTLPNVLLDEGIFFFDCQNTKIVMEKASAFAAGNPWLQIDFDWLSFAP